MSGKQMGVVAIGGVYGFKFPTSARGEGRGI